ncbi:hypothetical protein KBY88_13340 [Cyanobium sp. Morenito 9A2]|nr:hypothetical protein [Cyanobium sp. Morenito 9A2]
MELDLPPWTVAADIDLRSWLFAFGGGIRIEKPDALRQELLQRCRKAMEVNAEANAEQSPHPEQLSSNPNFFPSRLRHD